MRQRNVQIKVLNSMACQAMHVQFLAMTCDIIPYLDLADPGMDVAQHESRWISRMVDYNTGPIPDENEAINILNL